MSIALKTLCSENDNIFRLTLKAGHSGVRNTVSWVYMLEDDSIIPYFHGSELAVTSGIRAGSDPDWLGRLVRLLYERGAAGLVVNTGKYVFRIPADVAELCDELGFPLLTMPWEIHMTEMIQTFCTRIIQDRHESVLLDKALADALRRTGDPERNRQVLGSHYDPDGSFTVILIHTNRTSEDIWRPEGREYVFINSLRRFKTMNSMSGSKFGVIELDGDQVMVANNVERSKMPELIRIILDVYRDAVENKALFLGVGTEVRGIENIGGSFQRATVAMRMALYKNVPFIRFEEMGFYKILFSVRDEEVLYSYADELLSPLDAEGASKGDYVELLREYIKNDRSLERTAEALYLHRNTVNYRLQKLRALLDSPLKTAEDLFPFEVALMIRDIREHTK